MTKSVPRIILGLIAGFFVAGIVICLLRFLGPAIGGWIVMLFNLSPNPELAKDMEAVGNIITLIIAIYLARKVYKKIADYQKDNKQIP